MGPIIRSWPTTAGKLRLGLVVAASVSEWKRIHSLTLAATSEMKQVEANWYQSGSTKCPGACPEDVYFAS